jgi:hypothetical protein
LAQGEGSRPCRGGAERGRRAEIVRNWRRSGSPLRTSVTSLRGCPRIIHKATKFPVLLRRGSWVQMTNPKTSKTGWVYSQVPI